MSSSLLLVFVVVVLLLLPCFCVAEQTEVRPLGNYGRALEVHFVHKPNFTLPEYFFEGYFTDVLVRYRRAVLDYCKQQIEMRSYIMQYQYRFKLCVALPAHCGYKERASCVFSADDTLDSWSDAANNLRSELLMMHRYAAIVYAYN